MPFTLQRSRRRVRVPNKFEDAICTLNQKNNSQIGDNNEQLENNKMNEGIKEIGVNDESKASDDGEKDVMSENQEEEMNTECYYSLERDKDIQTENNQYNNDGSHINPNKVNSIPMQVNVHTVKTCIRIGESNKSHAKQVTTGDCVDNKLNHIPTLINENGQEFVIFDDEIISEGSRKWELATCGYFVGYRMSIQELRYHLYRM
ncbi:hypothetical protein Tco_1236585 [Tanacetum coccineum]